MSVEGNAGTQSLPGGFIGLVDYHSLARSYFMQPLIAFKVLLLIVVIPCCVPITVLIQQRSYDHIYGPQHSVCTPFM
jgi:hypothetical protein